MKRLIYSLLMFFFSALTVFIWSPSLFAETGLETPSYGWVLVKTSFVLVGLCFVAYVGLKYLSKVNIGSPGPMKILGRLNIESRRSVVVIDVAGKTLIVGNSEAGMQTLGELDEDQRKQFEIDNMKPKPSFKDLLARSKEIQIEEEA